MELNEAIALLKKTVKYPGTMDSKHFDLTLVPVEDKPKFEKALMVAQLAIKEGKITRDEFNRRVHLDS
jgi:hypothetical protein